jgi:hypothetical protein
MIDLDHATPSEWADYLANLLGQIVEEATVSHTDSISDALYTAACDAGETYLWWKERQQHG